MKPNRHSHASVYLENICKNRAHRNPVLGDGRRRRYPSRRSAIARCSDASEGLGRGPPSPALDAASRKKNRATCAKAMQEMKYLGVAPWNSLRGRRIYIIEMNTRIQVEHPSPR